MRPRAPRKLAAAAAGALLISACLLYGWFAHHDYPTGFATPNEIHDIPRIIAHMGSGTSAPGNTLEAARQLLSSEIGGFEMDIQITSDGVPVVFHELTLDGATTGTGSVAALTAADLSRLRLVVDGRVSEHPIPTLDAMLQLVGPAKFLFLDIKDSGVRDTGMAAAVARSIDAHDLHRTVIVESFNPIFLHRMRATNPKVRIMFDFLDESVAAPGESPEQLAQVPWFLKQEWIRRSLRGWIQPDLLGPRFAVAPELLRSLAERGYPMVAWTVDDAGIAAALFDNGVAAVESNKPHELAAELAGRSPQQLDDASRLNRTTVASVVRVLTEEDVRAALQRARRAGSQVSIAGRRHSMGGQTFGPNNIVLDMTSFRQMSLEPESGILMVQSGASWADVQRFLDPQGRAVLVMQSDTIFTVGGSLSVNAHGWQPHSPPIASTVRSFRMMLASGETVTCSREENPDLFAAVLGGYGLLGVILDARLQSAPNELYRKKSWFFPSTQYEKMFRRHVLENPSAGLAYGRLSVHGVKLFSEAGLHVYERVSPQPASLAPMDEEGMVTLKREIFRASERNDAGKRMRWLVEKRVGPSADSGPITRNSAMHPDIHLVWPEDPAKRDILQEYFVPRGALQPFLDALATIVRDSRQNLLNVTVRYVLHDNETVLAYAGADSYSLVLFFSQDASAEAEADMEAMTRHIIDRVLSLHGSFYLPYRLHYARTQFLAAYPNADRFLQLKALRDPETRFSSWFYTHISAEPPAGQLLPTQ